MTLPVAGDGLRVVYQGHVCSPVYHYPRSAGLEPDFGFVHVPRAQFQDFLIKENFVGVDAQGNAGLRALATRTDEPAGGRGFVTLGDLIIVERLEGAIVGEVFYRNVLLTERALTTVFAVEDASEIVRLELTDPRYLLDRRGSIVGWFNVATEGAQLDVRTSTTVARGPSPLVVGAKGLAPGSLRNGAPWTLRQILEEVILPHAAGFDPVVHRLPAGYEDATPLNLVWMGVPPKTAIRDVLAPFPELVFTLRPDARVSLWLEAEGDPIMVAQGAQQGAGAGAADEPIPLEVVQHELPSVAYHHRPITIHVKGPPAIKAILVQNLEAVGEVGGRLMPAFDAAALLGFSAAQALRFVIAKPDERVTLFPGVTEAALLEMDRWFLKWFRLPAANHAVLPMLADRYTVARDGLKLPIRVLAESVAAVNLYQLGLISPALQNRAAAAIVAAAPSVEQLKAARILVNQPLREQTSGFTIDHEQGVVKLKHVVARISGAFATNLGELQLEGPGRVDVEFCFHSKPALDDALTVDHIYSSFWQAEPGDPALTKIVAQKVGFPSPNFARIIERDDFQLVTTLDGSTNLGSLDALAQQLAEQVFNRPLTTAGAVVKLGRPVAALCTGRVRSVVHMTEGDLPRVVLYLGTSEPLYPVSGSEIVSRARAPRQAVSDQSFLRESKPRAIPGSIGS